MPLPAKFPMFDYVNRGLQMNNLSALAVEYSFFINMGFVAFAVIVIGLLLRKRPSAPVTKGAPHTTRGTK